MTFISFIPYKGGGILSVDRLWSKSFSNGFSVPEKEGDKYILYDNKGVFVYTGMNGHYSNIKVSARDLEYDIFKQGLQSFLSPPIESSYTMKAEYENNIFINFDANIHDKIITEINPSLPIKNEVNKPIFWGLTDMIHPQLYVPGFDYNKLDELDAKEIARSINDYVSEKDPNSVGASYSSGIDQFIKGEKFVHSHIVSEKCKKTNLFQLIGRLNKKYGD